MSIPKSELDKLTAVEANQWFESLRREHGSQILRCAYDYYNRALAKGLENAEEERIRLFEVLAMREEGSEAQAEYFAQRKGVPRPASAVAMQNVERNLEEGRQRHLEAVEKAKAEGKITDAVRKAYNDERRRQIEAAHVNPDPAPFEPVTEARDERIVNDQLRSFGSIVKIDTGKIGPRIGQKRAKETG